MSAYLMPVDKGKRIELNKAILFVGRHPECDVVLTRSRKISRKHCCIVMVHNSVVVRDLGSMNGVCINGKRLEENEARLKVGDELTIGDCRYVLKLGQEKEPPDSAPAAQRGKPVDDDSRPNADASPPENLNQSSPIPLLDSQEEFSVDPPLPNTPEAVPRIAIHEPEDDLPFDFDDDAVRPKSKDEFKDSGSQIGLE